MEVNLGRMEGPFDNLPLPNLRISLLGGHTEKGTRKCEVYPPLIISERLCGEQQHFKGVYLCVLRLI